MVSITGYEKKTTAEEKDFFVLQLQGDVEITFSQATGLPYATVKKCSIPSTFNEAMCKSLIGKELKGSIVKVATDAYEYTIPETGEVKIMEYHYSYSPEEEHTSTEQAVFSQSLIM